MPVVLEENPDESVAYGVGMAAAIKERTGDIKDMLLTDVEFFQSDQKNGQIVTIR